MYVSFQNSRSYCTGSGELPYRTALLTIAMNDFTGAYVFRETDAPDLYFPPSNAEVVFDGNIGCFNSCEIGITSAISGYTVWYENDAATGEIVVAIDTGDIRAAQFRLWNYK